MNCHYDRKLTKKNFANFAKKLDEHHAAVVNATFDDIPLVDKMIRGYNSMKKINREIVDEYAEASKQDLTKVLVDTYNNNPNFDYMKGNINDRYPN